MASNNTKAQAQTASRPLNTLTHAELRSYLRGLEQDEQEYVGKYTQEKTLLEERIKKETNEHEPIRKKTMNKLRNLKNEVERMERGMNVRQTIYDGRQLEARGDINALEARVQDKLEFNKQKRKEINDLLQEPPKKAATPVADLDKEEHKPAPVVAKKRRRIVDSDDDEEPQASEHRATGADDA